MTLNYLSLALEQARAAALRGEVPVGAVLVDSITGEIIARAGNRTEERGDPTAHAEMLALQEGFRIRNEKFLSDCDLYVTLEPCPMCAAAISLARIRRLYFGAYDPKSGGVEHGPRVFSHATCHHKPEVYGGMMESECGEVLREFFARLRT